MSRPATPTATSARAKARQYAARLADELEQTFQRLGPDSVMAFVAEPVVGATLARSRPCPRISAASAKSATAMACC